MNCHLATGRCEMSSHGVATASLGHLSGRRLAPSSSERIQERSSAHTRGAGALSSAPAVLRTAGALSAEPLRRGSSSLLRCAAVDPASDGADVALWPRPYEDGETLVWMETGEEEVFLGPFCALLHCAAGGAVQATTRSPSKRSVHYEDGETFVWMETGEEEVFLSQGEVLEKLEAILGALPTDQVPADLRRFETLREAGEFLLDSACELQLPGTLGTYQWFSVRLE